MDEICSVCGTGLTGADCSVGCAKVAQSRLQFEAARTELMQSREAVGNALQLLRRDHASQAKRDECLAHAQDALNVLLNFEDYSSPTAKDAAKKVARLALQEISEVLGPSKPDRDGPVFSLQSL